MAVPAKNRAMTLVRRRLVGSAQGDGSTYAGIRRSFHRQRKRADEYFWVIKLSLVEGAQTATLTYLSPDLFRHYPLANAVN